MKWIKRGLIWAPDKNHPFGSTRIMCPTPFVLNANVLRIFAGFCDADGISRPGFIDISSNNPSKILRISSEPLLEIGEPGTFDDNGLCPTSIVKEGANLLMYYFGFQKGVKVPFYMFSGLAISSDNGNTWKRFSKVPVLDRSNEEPIMRSGPFVIRNGNYKIYYPCGSSFIKVNNKLVHTYQIHFSSSPDGRKWPGAGIPAIKFQNEDEYGFGRPYVFKEHRIYKMTYSIRTKSKGYRIGYAESIDGASWDRKDHLIDIDVSEKGWDSEMLCYSSILSINRKTYLFYNGNNLGSTGFGYAEYKEAHEY